MSESTSKYDDIVQWLNNHKYSAEITKILQKPFALHFLIVWSLFEVKYFKPFMKKDDCKKFFDRVQKIYDGESINTISKKFHSRYQNKRYYQNLRYMGKDTATGKNKYQEVDNIDKILKQNFNELSLNKKIELLVYVIYRYRNNIFHGNKGITSWLDFDKQIKDCTKAMQIFLDSDVAENI